MRSPLEDRRLPFDAAPVGRCGNLHHGRLSPLTDNIAGQAALMPALATTAA